MKNNQINQKQLLKEQELLFQNLERRSRELSAILEVSQAVSSKLSLPELLEATINSCQEALGFDAVTIHLIEGDRLIMKAYIGVHPDLAERIREFKLEGESFELVAKTGRTSIVNYFDKEGQIRGDITAQAKKTGYTVLLRVPIRVGGRTLGTLGLGSKMVNKIEETKVRLAESIAGQIGIALENARLYEQAQRQAQRLSVVAELNNIITSSLNIEDVFESFAQRLKELVDFDRLSISRYRGDKVELVAVFPHESEPRAGNTFLMSEYDNDIITNLRDRQTPIIRDIRKINLLAEKAKALEQGLKTSLLIPLVYRGMTIGALNLSSRNELAYNEESMEILKELSGQVATAIINDQLYKELKQDKDTLAGHVQELEDTKLELEDSVHNLAKGLVKAWESRYPYKSGHSERVASLCQLLSKVEKVSSKELRNLPLAGLLHDIGMITLPDEILLRPPPLKPADWVVLRMHPDNGADLLASLGFPRDVIEAVRYHHERYNGTGYPKGLKARKIPLVARILAVADAYDAITSGAPFRPPKRSHDEAMKELRDNAGSQFDAEVVELLERVTEEGLPSD